MAKVRVAINGFGRIGRCTLAHIAEAARNDVQVVRINATGPIETNAHLLKYDSVHGRFGGPVKVAGNTIDLGRGPIEVMSTYNPEELDWEGVDVVLECTGKFNDRDKAAVHLTRGAKRVLVSAPAKRAAKAATKPEDGGAADDVTDVDAFRALKSLATPETVSLSVGVVSAETHAVVLDSADLLIDGVDGCIALLAGVAAQMSPLAD